MNVVEIFRKIIVPFRGRGIGNFRPLKIGYKILIALFNPIEVQGHKMFINDPELLTNPYSENFRAGILKRELKRGDIALDLGANLGYFTLFMAKIVGEEGKVFAFEPHPKNFSLLKKNIEINGYRNIILVQKAVSDRIGKEKLYYKKDGRFTDGTLCPLQKDRSFVEVETVKLADFIKERINFIKMDIEGAEGLVIQDVPLIFKNKPLKMLFEFHPKLIKKFGLEPLKILTTLEDYGFDLFKINEKEKKIELVKDLQQLLDETTNIFAKNL